MGRRISVSGFDPSGGVGENLLGKSSQMKSSSSLPLDRYQHRHSCLEIFKTAASLLAQRFTDSRMITVRLPPPGLPGGINSSTSFHSSSVKSLG
jgi:hypothetical protein